MVRQVKWSCGTKCGTDLELRLYVAGFIIEMPDDWCPGAESNYRHRDFQSREIPSKIRQKVLTKASNSHY